MARKLSDTVKLQLRLSEALRRRLERAAKAGDQSMNTEIVHRLEESLYLKEEAKLVGWELAIRRRYPQEFGNFIEQTIERTVDAATKAQREEWSKAFEDIRKGGLLTGHPSPKRPKEEEPK